MKIQFRNKSQVFGSIFLLGGPVLFAGCTSYALHQLTFSQMQSVQTIQYQMVLDNIAMFIDSPGAIPWHITIAKGTASVGDSATAGFGEKWPPSSQSYALSGGRIWSGDWTITPVLDTNLLTQLSFLYEDAASNAENTSNFWLRYQKGTIFPEYPYLCGHYGTTFVSVNQDDPEKYESLTEFTLMVLICSEPVMYYATNDINLKSIGRLLKQPEKGSFWWQIKTNLNGDTLTALSAYDPAYPNPADKENAFRAAISDNLNVLIDQNVPICDSQGFNDLTNHVTNLATLSLLRSAFAVLGDLSARHKDQNGKIDQVFLPTVAKLNQVLLNYGFTSDQPLYPPSGPQRNFTQGVYNGSVLR